MNPDAEKAIAVHCPECDRDFIDYYVPRDKRSVPWCSVWCPYADCRYRLKTGFRKEIPIDLRRKEYRYLRKPKQKTFFMHDLGLGDE